MASAAPSAPIKLLRPGTFTDVRGTRVTFTRDDLQQAVDSYDRDSDPAPLVVGHPTIDAPAYGWVGRLAIENDHLVAYPDEIAPAFAEAVAAKHYRKVSPQLYPPASAANPKPGRWYLQHIGFLGGAAPAIKGLGTVAFSDAADADVLTLENPMTDTPDDTQAVAFAERDAALATREARLAQREAEIAAHEDASARAAAAARHESNVSFAEGLIAAGTLAPAFKDKVVALQDQMETREVVSFGEGDANRLTPLAAFRSLFDQAQPVVAFGEAAPASRKAAEPGVVVSFAAPAGYGVVPDNAALHARAKAIQAADPKLTFWDAFNRARAEPAE